MARGMDSVLDRFLHAVLISGEAEIWVGTSATAFGTAVPGLHLYAIWDEWLQMDVGWEQRCDVILDAYKQLCPQDTRDIGFAEGLDRDLWAQRITGPLQGQTLGPCR